MGARRGVAVRGSSGGERGTGRQEAAPAFGPPGTVSPLALAIKHQFAHHPGHPTTTHRQDDARSMMEAHAPGGISGAAGRERSIPPSGPRAASAADARASRECDAAA